MAIVKLGSVARECRQNWTGPMDGVPIVGLEHLTPEEITLSSWDHDTDNTFSKRFEKGQVLLGRRRVYLKKAVIAPFDGICSGDITVIEAIPSKIVPELLPFIIQNDKFFDFAMQGSAGSLSPRVKWEHLKDYEFDIPDIPAQHILANKLWAAYRLKQSYKSLIEATDEMVKSRFIEVFGAMPRSISIKNHCKVVSGKSIPISMEDVQGTIPYIKVADFNRDGNEKYIVSAQRYVARESADLSIMVPVGSVLFAKNGAASLSNKKRLTKIECCIDMNTMAIIPQDDAILPGFLFAIIQAMDISEHVRQGAVPSISPKSIEDYKIALPPKEEQATYIELTKQADKSKFELKESIEKIDKVMRALID